MAYQSVLRSDLFDNMTILITGGGSGIGRCIAHELAHLGGEVILLGRTDAKLRKVQQEIEERGGLARTCVCDIRDSKQLEEVIKDLPPVDALVNCAGGQFPALLSEMSSNGFDAVVRNNLLSTFNVSRTIFDHSMRTSGGAIVNITANEVGGMPLMAHTAAARAGVHSLTQTCALEWAEFGIRVNAVAPGFINSSGFDTYTDERMSNAIKHYPTRMPIGRAGTESELSAMVCFLLSPGGAYITGQVLRVDGGASLNVGSGLYDAKPARDAQIYDGFDLSRA